MALTPAKSDFISRIAQMAQKYTDDYAALLRYTTMFYGTRNYHDNITAADIAENPNFVEAGLTVAVLHDAVKSLDDIMKVIERDLDNLIPMSEVSR